MLTKDPRKRITLPEALSHNLFDADNERLLKNVRLHKKDIIKNLNTYKNANSFNKAIRMCLSKIYESNSLDKLKELFLAGDTDHNGRLDKLEFEIVMKKLDFEKDEIDVIWLSLDTSGDGEIE